jgi:thiol-disulfide isomerase/thioredoxin
MLKLIYKDIQEPKIKNARFEFLLYYYYFVFVCLCLFLRIRRNANLMGCCGRNKKKFKSKNDVTKINKKIISIDETNYSIPENLIDQNQILKTEPNQTPIIENTTEVKSSSKQPLISSSDNISSTDNISPIKTLNDLQTFVEQNKKSISIILFYGHYCPYSKRTIPDLRQWARVNKDRIFLYEADVEQASKLAEYYHIRTIPTIMAFKENNLLAPIWQRTANNVLSSSSSINEEYDKKFDNSNPIEISNEIKQEQYLIIPDEIPSKIKYQIKNLI